MGFVIGAGGRTINALERRFFCEVDFDRSEEIPEEGCPLEIRSLRGNPSNDVLGITIEVRTLVSSTYIFN